MVMFSTVCECVPSMQVRFQPLETNECENFQLSTATHLSSSKQNWPVLWMSRHCLDERSTSRSGWTWDLLPHLWRGKGWEKIAHEWRLYTVLTIEWPMRYSSDKSWQWRQGFDDGEQRVWPLEATQNCEWLKWATSWNCSSWARPTV